MQDLAFLIEPKFIRRELPGWRTSYSRLVLVLRHLFARLIFGLLFWLAVVLIKVAVVIAIGYLILVGIRALLR